MRIVGGMFKGSFIPLAISILISEGIGALSAFFSMGTMEKYKMLNQAPFSPPGWIFPVVWGILYLLMGVASYLVYSSGADKKEVKSALSFYTLQLAFNFFWTILFFRFELRGFAFLWIIALLILIIITTVKFYRINRTAGYLMIPYVLWVSFASVLNFAIWQLNK